jgi:hypothetical protein
MTRGAVSLSEIVSIKRKVFRQSGWMTGETVVAFL